MYRTNDLSRRFLGFCLVGCLVIVPMVSQNCAAQTRFGAGEDRAEQALSEQAATEADARRGENQQGDAELTLPVLDLFWRGGYLMIPITAMSFVVVAVGLERLIALRRGRIFPRRLRYELEGYVVRGNFDPLHANQLSHRYPSSAATVLQAMIAKSGRPHAEIERAIEDSIQREADRLYSPVRTLNLAAAVTPLLGLLGTVSGMIQAFFVTANLPLGSNRAQALAEGIYIALVTTFAGLSVAIPAAVLAHIFETRILGRLRDVEQSIQALLPQLEKQDGKPRRDHQQGPHGDGVSAGKASVGPTKVS